MIADTRTPTEEHFAAAVHAIRLSGVRLSDHAAVVGSGPLALATVAGLLARGVGKVTLLSDTPPAHLPAAARVLPIPTSPADFEGARAQLGGYGPEVVFECEGSSASPQLAIELAKPAGLIVMMTEPAGATNMSPNLLVFADKRVKGSGPFEPEDLAIARDLAASGRLPREMM